MDSITPKVAVDHYAADNPQDSQPGGGVYDPQKPCLDVDAEVWNLEVDPTLPKKFRVKPKPICRKKGKLSKNMPKKSPIAP